MKKTLFRLLISLVLAFQLVGFIWQTLLAFLFWAASADLSWDMIQTVLLATLSPLAAVDILTGLLPPPNPEFAFLVPISFLSVVATTLLTFFLYPGLQRRFMTIRRFKQFCLIYGAIWLTGLLSIILLNIADEIHMRPGQTTEAGFSLRLTKKMEIETAMTEQGIDAMAWAPDGSILALSGEENRYLTTLDTSGHTIFAGEIWRPYFSIGGLIAFVNGAEHIVYGAENSYVSYQDGTNDVLFDIRDATTGAIVRQIRGDHAQEVYSLAVSSDQKFVATMAEKSPGINTITIYNTASWSPLKKIDVRSSAESFSSIAFFPDGKHLAILAGTEILIEDIATGSVTQRIPLYDNTLSDLRHSMAISPAGDQILVSSSVMSNKPLISSSEWERFEKSIKHIQIMRVSDGQEISSFNDEDVDYVDAVAWDPKGRYVAFSSGLWLYLWQPTSGGLMKITLENQPGAIAITPDGHSLAVASYKKVLIYDIQ